MKQWKRGCKQQREEWVWLHSWGKPPTSLTPERSAESAGSDEDSRWQLATGGCNTVSQWSGRTARRLRCTEQHLTRAPPACSGITVSSHVTLQKPVDSDRRHCLAAHSGQVVLHLTKKKNTAWVKLVKGPFKSFIFMSKSLKRDIGSQWNYLHK